jgi:hypothetical protein
VTVQAETTCSLWWGWMMNVPRIDEYAGLHRTVEIGLRLAPTMASAAAVAKAAASYIDRDDTVPVRLAGLSCEGSRMHITLAISLGSIDEVKVAAPNSRAAVILLETLVEQLSAYDPALVALPDAHSPEAQRAAVATRSARAAESTGVSADAQLVAVG